MKKKIVAVLLSTVMALSVAACGSGDSGNGSSAAGNNDSNNSASASTDSKASTDGNNGGATEGSGEYVLEELYVIVDGTVISVDGGQDEFKAQWEQLVGEKLGHPIKLTIEQPEHSKYSEQVSQILSTRQPSDPDYPDAMIMGASMFRAYSTTGMLWDMADAYENADFRKNVRFENNEFNKDDQGHLYGLSPTRGNGCVTYVKQNWLDAVGMKLEDIKTFDDYYAMLKAFTDQDPDQNGSGGTYGVIAAGYAWPSEAPYINYLPEFWQGAYPGIIKRDGVWVDGMQEQATIDALNRLHQAYEDGVIDPDTEEAGTKQAREKFWNADQSVASGTFAYWAGSWYNNICTNMIKQGIMNEGDQQKDLVMLPPIKEIQDTFGGYIDREAPAWVIMDDGDGNNDREQAIFDALFETMLDGDKIETLWVYGAEDVHWSTKAEEFYTESTNKDTGEVTRKDYKYEDGQFHMKQSLTDPNAICGKNHLDPILVIVPLTNGYDDPNPVVQAGNDFFNKYAVAAPTSPSNAHLTEIQSDLTDAKKVAINAAVTGTKTPEDAIADYVKEYGEDIQQILDELNAQ